MELDEREMRQGLKFIVGTWQVDYVVNAFSDDLAHIPVTEFKSDDGRDFSDITFTFNEDHTLVMKDTFRSVEENGTWEQTGAYEYRYTVGAFFDIPDSVFLENVQKLSVIEGCLVFSLGFLGIGMKKICDGVVTEEPDIGDIAPSEEDQALMGIVGEYRVVKAMCMVGDGFDLHTREEAEADLKKKEEAGTLDGDSREIFNIFNMKYEFTPDHRVVTWTPIPEGIGEKEIEEALKAGEIEAVKDGYFAGKSKEWKALGGKYYYNTEEHRELFDEIQSPWDEIVPDENGLISFENGFVIIKRVDG